MRAGIPGARVLAALLAALALAALVACSSGESAPAATPSAADTPAYGSRIVATDRLFTFDDFKAAGVKHGKDYNVDGLPGATAAALGFYQTRDIEFRFFPSHEAAIEDGVPVAREIVGPDAHIGREFVTWIWAIADERACAPGNLGGGRDCTRQPKYGDFIVYGNVIIFCEGRNIDEAQADCKVLTDLLPAT